MMRILKNQGPMVAALALFLAGLGAAVWTYGGLDEWNRRLTTKRSYLSRLEVLGAGWAEAVALRDKLAVQPPGGEPTLAPIVSAAPGEQAPTFGMVTSSSPLPGWTEYRTTLTIHSMSPATVQALMQAVTTQSPSWSVTRCDLRANGNQGDVRATIEVTALMAGGGGS